jgi:hypothetical protein
MKFIPYEKLSKKRKKEVNAEKRNSWGMNPRTKVIPDKRNKKRVHDKNKEIEDET